MQRFTVTTAALAALAALSAPAQAASMYSALYAPSVQTEVDSIKFMSVGGAVMESTPGFAAEPGQTDTAMFPPAVQWPLTGVVIFYKFGHNPAGPLEIEPLALDTWYDMPTSGDSSQIRFYLDVGVSGPEGRPASVRIDVRPRVSAAGVRVQAPGGASLAVYDAAGSLVRVLRASVDGRAVWDGRSATGVRARGLYYVRAVTPAGTVTAKVLLVR